MYKKTIIALVAFGLANQAERCFASWAYVPQEVRMLQADLVVVGKIEKTAKQFEKNGTVYDVGLINPTAILKGKPAMMGDIRIAWPAPRRDGLAVSATIRYRVGQEGVWVLKADDELPVYWANYPSDYQRLDNLPTVKKKLEDLKSIKWGKPASGLQVGLFVEQHDLRKSKVKIEGKPVKAVARLSVYPLLKNAGAEPIHVVNNLLDRPVEVEFKGPDGAPIKVNLYGTRPKREVPLKAHNFVRLEPGQVGTIGYGYGLPVLTKSGAYSIRLSYQNVRGSGDLEVEPVWKGTASSSSVKVKVPAE